MLGAFGVWTIRVMQRGAEEDQAAHVGQEALRGGLRGHAAAHGFSSGKYRELGGGFCRDADGGGDGRGEYWRGGGGGGGLAPVGGLAAGGGVAEGVAALLHVGKLVAEGGDVDGGEGVGEAGHEGVVNASAGPVAEDEKIFGFRRRQQEGGDFPAGRCFESKVFWFGHCAGF